MQPERSSKPVHAKIPFVPRFALLLAPVLAMVAVAVADAAPRHTQTWYVSATAPAEGNGSASAPFNSISQLVTVYGPGDTIMIEPAPIGTVLNGGLPLLPGQRLIGDGPPVVETSASLVPNDPTVNGLVRRVITAADYQYDDLPKRRCHRTGEQHRG